MILRERISNVEVFRLRVMRHDRVGRLLGHQHEILAEAHANLFRPQELYYERSIFQVRAGGISEAVAAAAILLLEDFANRGIIFAGEAQLLTHPLVPQLSKRLGRFNAEPMEIQVFLVSVGGSKVFRKFGGFVADGDELHTENVEFSRFDGAEKI